MKKRIFAILIAASMCLSLGACSSDESADDSGSSASSGDSEWDFSGISAEIDIDSTVIGDALTEFNNLVDEFNELTGAELEVVENGEDHESIMKTRMASNNMPDMFVTHGWSTIRYNEYTYDLSGESWVDDLSDAAASVVTDENGKVCSCPLTLWTYGVAYNETIMEENGIDMTTVKTFDDLEEVMQTLKDAGITPISCAGKSQALAGYMEYGNVFYSAEGALYDLTEELENGTFSYAEYPELLEMLADWYDNGYFIEDLFTTDSDTGRSYVASGEVAMIPWGSPEYVGLMKNINEDYDFGIIPVPSVEEDGNPAYTVGEGTSIAISESTENLELCLAFLEFITDAENLKPYVDSTGAISGFDTVSQDDVYSFAKYNETLEAYDNVVYTNFFDREYLPSGMWNYLDEAVSQLFNCDIGEAQNNVEAAAEYLDDAYADLYASEE